VNRGAGVDTGLTAGGGAAQVKVGAGHVVQVVPAGHSEGNPEGGLDTSGKWAQVGG